MKSKHVNTVMLSTNFNMNRTLLNSTRSMLKHMNCDKMFWVEAGTTACYIRNHVTTTGPNNTTPLEIWIGKKPDVGHLRVFGSRCCYTILKENIKKAGQDIRSHHDWISEERERIQIVGFQCPKDGNFTRWFVRRNEAVDRNL
jgi:hypothetical protein